MFFYKEIEQNGSLTLTLNLENFTFSDTLLNTQTTGTFIITADGTGSETITITDDSGEVTITPSSFNLNGGESQTVTLLFTPTTTGSKSGTVTVVGSNGNSSSLPVTGSGFLFEEAAYLTGSFANQSYDYYGISVALNATGDRLAVGATGDERASASSVSEEGLVYIYSKISGTWVEEQVLSCPNPSIENGNLYFGESIIFNQQGNMLLVGSPGNMKQELLPAGSTVKYYFKLRDTFGDGFNGATVQIRQGTSVVATIGNTFTDDLANGNGPVYETVSLVVGQTYNLYFNNGGTYPSEVRVSVIDSNFFEIYGDYNPHSVGDVIYTWTASGNKYFDGLAHMFVSGSNGWALQQQFAVPITNADYNDDFATSITMNSSGNIIAIGAPEDERANKLPVYAEGLVYIYQNNGSEWQQRQVISASNFTNITSWSGNEVDSSNNLARIASNFGFRVAMSDSGEHLAITAVHANRPDSDVSNFQYAQGLVIMYVSGANGYVEEQTLSGSLATEFDEFGYSIAMNSTGNKIAIGAVGDESDPQSQESRGLVYVFASGSNGWIEEQILSGSFVNDYDLFGISVSINSAGDRIIVGCSDGERPTKETYHNEGMAYLFISGSGGWVQQQVLTGSFANNSNDDFGHSVAINDAGNEIVVSTFLDEIKQNTPETGLVYLFTLNEEFNGFKYVNSTGKLAAFNNSGLTSISGEFFIKGDMPTQTEFTNLETVNGNMYVGQSSVEELAMPNLTYISESLTISDNSGLSTVQLPSLENIGGDLIISEANGLTTIEIPLDSVGGDINLSDNDSLQTVNLGSASVGGDVIIGNNASLQTVDLTGLESIAGDLTVTTNDSLQTVILDNSNIAGDLVLSNNSGLTTVDLAGGQVGGDINLSDNSALTTVELSATNIGGDLTLTNNTALETVQFSGSGVTGSISVTYNSLLTILDLSNVNNIGGSIIVTDNSNLTTLNLTNLQNVVGDLIITDNDSISTLDLTNLVSVSGDLIINYPSGANVIIPPAVVVGGTNQITIKS